MPTPPIHVNLRIFAVVCLLAAACGAAFAGDVEEGTPTKFKDARSLATVNVTANAGSGAISLPPVQVTAIVPDFSGAITLAVYNIPSPIRGRAYVANNPDSTADIDKDRNGCENSISDPIRIDSGAKVETFTDFALPGEMGLRYERFFNSQGPTNRKWTNTFSYFLDATCELGGDDPTTGACRQTKVYRPDGSTLLFLGIPSAYTTRTQQGSGGIATLTHNADNTWTLYDENANSLGFDAAGVLSSIINPSGIGWTLSADAAGLRVTHTNGQYMTIENSYDSVNNISVTKVTDPANNLYRYEGTYQRVILPGTPQTIIDYKQTSPYGGLLTEIDYNGVPYAYTTYAGLRAVSNELADHTERTVIDYGTDGNGHLKATITNPMGHTWTQVYAGINNQLSSVSHGALPDCGSTVSNREYDSYGNLSATIDNNNNLHTYVFSSNGQLQTETEAAGTSIARTTDYVWDPDLRLNRLKSVVVRGLKKTTYTYNNRNRLASEAVTNLSSEGTTSQTLTTTYDYTLYANSIVHTMTVTHPSPNNSNREVYTYDTLGNLSTVVNGLGQKTTYSNYNGLGEPGRVAGPNGDTADFAYDPRGRLSSKTTYPNGVAAKWLYTYDGFGLLASVSAPDGEVTTWNRDAVMRVTTMTHNDKDGTSTETYGYNANNDVTSKTVSRNGTGIYSTSTTYDALGRLYQINGNHGQQLTYSYDGNGNVLSVTDATGHVTSYKYDALNRVTQKAESGGASPSIPSGVPTLSAPANSINGSYTLSWTAVSGAATYELQEQVNGGSWTTVQNNSGLGWSASGKANGTYGYRAHACNVTGCGPWSNLATVAVLYPPGAPGLSVPAGNNTGSYTVSWSAVATATSYNLQERVNGGSWATVQSNGATAWSAAGKANGTYGYQVQACNASGCSAWSTVGSVAVLLPPASAPSLSAPPSNATGGYTVSWTSVATAASYNLQEQINGGSWTTVQTSNATSWGAAGKSNGIYAYRVQACNSGGCSAWSPIGTTTVLLPPGSPPSVSSPGTNSTGSYTVSWSMIANATSYNLQEQVNGGAWSTVQSTGATTWSATGKANGTYGYQAQSCNSGGCSAWSSVSTITVLHPPGSAPTLSVPGSSTNGSYMVSWSAVSTATSYNLQEQVNGGAWTTVQSSGSTSWSTSGRGDATYGYQVQACNGSGCGPWSSVGSTTVLLPPGSAPSLSVPGSSGSGSYTVSWSNVATATSYNLQEQVNGGGWTTVQSNASTSWSTSGRGDATYGYQVQACNSSGCGPWSSVASTTVLLPPSSAPALSVPGTSGNGSYTVSWSGVSTASSYTLQEQVNGGSWATVQANGNTNWNASGKGTATYGYRVQACNSGGCGPWSGTGSITVTIPVPIAIDGQGYTSSSSVGSTGGASAAVGFDIAGGGTWEVFTANQRVAKTVIKSGAVPSGATTVQYTWTEVGLANGANLGGGTVTNGASSPTAVSSNPSSNYYVAMAKNSTNVAGLTYRVTVTFYNAAGANISSSTCTMTAVVAGTL